ncbi:zinc finger and BTB domain-containing protein 38 [Hippocampus zosterae]|uniref:zinc finger and BTB domain-containing protein 38 n=1 Tax=Hippocampus zosterae TaxID=109293 RepID=UPI00223DC193|nr:zinc finger and BTB domain-containing protein 38 [Hippocampus zosterae]
MDSFHPHTVLSKLNEQRSLGLFCDVTIVVEDVKFRAHKNILAACSGYFKNALSNETWSSSRVLELMDLKSDVFACVLNFIYSAKVTSPCVEDKKELIAAGKRLGIPFLEKLAGQEKKDKNQYQLDCVKSTDWISKKTKEEVTRPEEIDGSRGPRITNAFSITEVCPGNNPFTPLGDEKASLSKTAGSKTQTYIAKPVCPGPSADGQAIPLCQITVKIGDEAIIRRRIKGSKLFPRRKKRETRKLGEMESQSQLHPDGKLESPRLRFRPDISCLISETHEDPNDCDVADELWRPYYSYKAKKKKKKRRFKHRQALFHDYNETARTDTGATEARLDSWQTGDSISGGEDVKRSLHRSCSPRTSYNCDICDSSFITETGLRAHIIGSHPYFCHTCGKQGPPGETPSGNDYVCNSCMENGSCFDNSTSSSNPEKKFRCSFCPQRFLYLATKRSHEKKHQETAGESYTSQPCLEYFDNLSMDNKKDCIKTEEDDNQEISDMQCEEGGHFPMKTPKTEDELMTLSPHQDITYTHIKSSLSHQTETLFTLASPSKMKHKVKKIINPPDSFDQAFKPQAQKRDASGHKDSLEVNSVIDGQISCKPSTKNASDMRDDPVSLHKPEKRMCKDETFF